MAKSDDLNALMTGLLVFIDQVTWLEPYLPQLGPDKRKRVNAYVTRASTAATLRTYKFD